MNPKYSEEYLQHYGVPGMKWGVRRNIRVLANNRRNRKVARIKGDYKSGNISKQDKRKLIKEANKQKKTDMRDMNSRLNKAKSLKEFNSIKRDISKQTVSEVPASRLKKGATTINKLFHIGYGVTYGAGGLAIAATTAAISPAAVPAALVATAMAEAVTVGEYAVFQMGIDKLS